MTQLARLQEDQTGPTAPSPYHPEICRSVQPKQTDFDISEVRKDAYRIAGLLIKVQDEPMLQKVFSKRKRTTNVSAEKFLELPSALTGENSHGTILLKTYSFPDVRPVTR